MICWVIKQKGKGHIIDAGWTGDDSEYGKLVDAVFYRTRKGAMEDVKDREDIVKIEIRVLD